MRMYACVFILCTQREQVAKGRKKESVKQVPLTYCEHVFIVLKVRKNVVHIKNTQPVTTIHRTYFIVQHCAGGNSTSVSESQT